MRRFKTGATRDTEEGKLDYAGFLSPIVLESYAKYLDKHRLQADGKSRESSNWKRGIPKEVYLKSAFRHLIDWWKETEGFESRDGIEDAINGVIFNCMGYLYELKKTTKKT